MRVYWIVYPFFILNCILTWGLNSAKTLSIDSPELSELGLQFIFQCVIIYNERAFSHFSHSFRFFSVFPSLYVFEFEMTYEYFIQYSTERCESTTKLCIKQVLFTILSHGIIGIVKVSTSPNPGMCAWYIIRYNSLKMISFNFDLKKRMEQYEWN